MAQKIQKGSPLNPPKGKPESHYINKVAETLQRKDENPGDFYERLCEAYRICPFNPESLENQRMINMAFVCQSAGDMKRKLQKLEGFTGMNISQLLEVVNKVYVNREAVSKKEDEYCM